METRTYMYIALGVVAGLVLLLIIYSIINNNNPNNVSLAVKAIDLYKLESGLSSQPSSGKKVQSQSMSPSAADMVSTKTKTVNANEPKVWTQREITALSMVEYDKYEKEIDAAIIEGRVVA